MVFLSTLSEACQETEWQVHASCLTSNHFHLVRGKLGWSVQDLAGRRKRDPRQWRIAARLRQETTMAPAWIAERFHMESRAMPHACSIGKGETKGKLAMGTAKISCSDTASSHPGWTPDRSTNPKMVAPFGPSRPSRPPFVASASAFCSQTAACLMGTA